MGARILLVEDDDSLRITRRMVLGDWAVLPTCSGKALGMLKTQQPLDIVFIGQSVAPSMAATIGRCALELGLELLLPHQAAEAANESPRTTKAEIYSPPLAPTELCALIAVLSARRAAGLSDKPSRPHEGELE